MARAKKVPSAVDGDSKSNGIPSEYIRLAAYYHWEKRGCPVGDDWRDWLEAEKETKESRHVRGVLPLKVVKAKKSVPSERNGKLSVRRKLALAR